MEQEIIAQILQHIGKLNDEFGQLANAVVILQTDVAWLKQFFWVLFGASVTAIIGSFWGVLILRRNNKDKK